MSSNLRFPTGLTVFVVGFGFAFSIQDRVNSCCIWLDLWGFLFCFLNLDQSSISLFFITLFLSTQANYLTEVYTFWI